jgi:hypothetical protein
MMCRTACGGPSPVPTKRPILRGKTHHHGRQERYDGDRHAHTPAALDRAGPHDEEQYRGNRGGEGCATQQARRRGEDFDAVQLRPQEQQHREQHDRQGGEHRRAQRHGARAWRHGDAGEIAAHARRNATARIQTQQEQRVSGQLAQRKFTDTGPAMKVVATALAIANTSAAGAKRQRRAAQ